MDIILAGLIVIFKYSIIIYVKGWERIKNIERRIKI